MAMKLLSSCEMWTFFVEMFIGFMVCKMILIPIPYN